MKYITKLLTLLKDEGVSGTIHRVLTSLRARIMLVEDKKWESKNRISTVEIEEYAGGVVENDGFFYVPSNRRLIHTLVWNIRKYCDLDNHELSDFTFVDYGSGKGQVLLTVAEYPFKEIIGVEYLADLYQNAKSNIDIFQKDHPMSPPIRLVKSDAGEFDLPDSPCVLYFYNPFNENIMASVIRKIKEAQEKLSYPVIIIYVQLRNEDPGNVTNNIELIKTRLPVRDYTTVYRSLLDKFLLGSNLISVSILPGKVK